MAQKYLGLPFVVGCGISILFFWVTKSFYESYRDPALVEQNRWLEEVERLHNQTVDFRLRRRGPRTGSPDVAVLTIDEKAIQKFDLL